MKNVLIIENSLSGLKMIKESASSVPIDKKYYLGGTFTEFDVKNRNERIYTADKFLPHLNELLERKKKLGIVYGEFDHPDVFDTSLSRISHTIESLTYVKETNVVEGTIRLLKTHYGKEARALVDDDCPIFVSSRAAGVTESNGVVTIKKLFTYDAVADPGFSSAKMEVKSINESLGFNESTNFRVYEISDESKINDLFNMNKNDYITKKQMIEYSNYLTEEIQNTKELINNKVKSNNFDPEDLLKLEERYESLHEGFIKISEYLDYLAENLTVLFDKNSKVENKTKKIIEHNNYLAKTIDKTINYTEYIAETLDKSIDFSDYIAENVDNNIEYSKYIAEQLDNNIEYSEYIAEHVDKNIEYSEYIAEHVDNNIEYSEYIAEHVDNNINYSEYIAENLSDNVAYGNYLAESLDKTISNISKGGFGKLNENIDFNPQDVSKYYEDDDDFVKQGQPSQVQGQEDQESGQPSQVQGQPSQVQDQEDQENVQPQGQPLDDEDEDFGFGIEPGMVVKIDDDLTGEVVATNDENGIVVVKLSDTGEVQEVQESRVSLLGDGKMLFESENSLKENIKRFINETKKRKVSDETEPHFLLFLTEKKKASYYNLSEDDKQKIKVAINESNGYTCESDVLTIMENALTQQESISKEELLISNIPSDLKPVWESLNSTVKQSILNGSQFYSNLTEDKMESFWRTRGLDRYKKVSPNKKLLSENFNKYDNYKLNESQLESYLSRLQRL
jgi:hypothetical protein